MLRESSRCRIVFRGPHVAELRASKIPYRIVRRYPNTIQFPYLPRPPQTIAASFKRLYRKRQITDRLEVFRRGVSDRVLTFGASFLIVAGHMKDSLSTANIVPDRVFERRPAAKIIGPLDQLFGSCRN